MPLLSRNCCLFLPPMGCRSTCGQHGWGCCQQTCPKLRNQNVWGCNGRGVQGPTRLKGVWDWGSAYFITVLFSQPMGSSLQMDGGISCCLACGRACEDALSDLSPWMWQGLRGSRAPHNQTQSPRAVTHPPPHPTATGPGAALGFGAGEGGSAWPPPDPPAGKLQELGSRSVIPLVCHYFPLSPSISSSPRCLCRWLGAAPQGAAPQGTAPQTPPAGSGGALAGRSATFPGTGNLASPPRVPAACPRPGSGSRRPRAAPAGVPGPRRRGEPGRGAPALRGFCAGAARPRPAEGRGRGGGSGGAAFKDTIRPGLLIIKRN